MKMKTTNGDNFNWDELLERIESGNIIPVIGLGLYWIEVDGKERLLYDFLAEKLANAVDFPLPPDTSHKFSKAAFRFLEKQKENHSDFLAVRKLRDFLLDNLKDLKLIAGDRFRKLARIKAFKIFINTTYDDFLVNTLRSARDYPTNALHYTLKDKNIHTLSDRLFNSLGYSKGTLVYNMYGNLKESVVPAFTEKDILETIVKFQKDMEVCRDNRLFLELEGSSLLFMGFSYDDWLFRFFVRTICNKPYRHHKELETCKYIGGDLGNKKKASVNELVQFLKKYGTEIYYPMGGRDFVDILFDKLEQHSPGAIIPVSGFPTTAFICFHGADRTVAAALAAGLRAGGINVWLDENKFEPGDEIDKTIIDAIEKCPVFIPLISRESREFLLENGKMKYHCQEWNWAYLFIKKYGSKSKTIMPVLIDGTDWMYDKFKDLYSLKIPGGKRDGGEGNFEKLRKSLETIQRNWTGGVVE